MDPPHQEINHQEAAQRQYQRREPQRVERESAGQAEENGLIDEVGSIYTAIDWAKQKTGHKKMNVVVYHRPQEWKTTVYAAAPVGAPEAEGREHRRAGLHRVKR
jgi:ClpP class serine protease